MNFRNFCIYGFGVIGVFFKGIDEFVKENEEYWNGNIVYVCI